MRETTRKTKHKSADRPRLVAVLAFEGAQLLDVAGPVQAFASANEIAEEAGGAAPYRVVAVSRCGGAVTTTSGLPLVTEPMARATGKSQIDTLIVSVGAGIHDALCDEDRGLGPPPGVVSPPRCFGVHRRLPLGGSRPTD